MMKKYLLLSTVILNFSMAYGSDEQIQELQEEEIPLCSFVDLASELNIQIFDYLTNEEG